MSGSQYLSSIEKWGILYYESVIDMGHYDNLSIVM